MGTMYKYKRINLNILIGILCILGSPLLMARGPAMIQDKIAAVAEKAFPAVVVIHAMQHGPIGMVKNGVGSGFIIHESGVIVTNYHVIKQAAALIVKDIHGKVFRGKIVGFDKNVDLAVLKIDSPKKFAKLTFADTDKLKVGHFVIAIGAPFNLEHTMTTGIVSHKKRTLGINARENYIQTDASINPGNSGGPLLDLEGHVVGVNDCILAPSGVNSGVGFAIDGNLARQTIRSIIRTRIVQRPFAGIVMEDNAQRSARPIISKIVPNSPAHTAGLQKVDLILQIEKHKAATIQDVHAIMTSNFRPGDNVTFLIRRNNSLKKIKLKFGRFPNEQ